MKPTGKRHGHDKLSVITLAGVIVLIILLIIWLTTFEYFSA